MPWLTAPELEVCGFLISFFCFSLSFVNLKDFFYFYFKILVGFTYLSLSGEIRSVFILLHIYMVGCDYYVLV